MKIEQGIWTPGQGWDMSSPALEGKADVVLGFGDRFVVAGTDGLKALQEKYPESHVVILSTAGSFWDTQIEDDGIVVTAIQMEKAAVELAAETLDPAAGLDPMVDKLLADVRLDELRHVMVFSDGGMVNGSELSLVFNKRLPDGVGLSGGLAGDGTRFEETLVGLNEEPRAGRVVMLAFYGEALDIGCGSAGGWSCFGPEREVTRSEANVLHQLDGKPALDLYKLYLGEEAKTLPSGALRFPLWLQEDDKGREVVRTILSIDEETGSMTFAGNVPEGSKVRFMRASYDDLVDGAEEAAEQAEGPAELLIGVSCVGRRIVLGERTEEELEALREAWGEGPLMCGFYSYGELAPSGREGLCQLHNQTMTLTRLTERVG